MSVNSTNKGRRKPCRMRGSGRPVRKNLTFVQSVDDDYGRDRRFPERSHDQLVHLDVEGFVCNARIGLSQPDKG